MKVHAYASLPHYRAHLQPIIDALPEQLRGERWAPYDRDRWTRRPHASKRPIDEPVLVAGWQDAQSVRPHPVIYVEHGAGQAYPGDPRSSFQGSYHGGVGLDHVRLFVCPRQDVADAWQERYPGVATVAAGCPRLDPWHRYGRPDRPHGAAVVAISFHWSCKLIPETDSALHHYRPQLGQIVKQLDGEGFYVVGHGHPRAQRLPELWQRLGVPWWGYADIMDAATIVIADNTSLLPEAASVGARLVFLNAPWYRRDVHHGGRFWDWPVGQAQAHNPDEVLDAVHFAVDDPWPVQASREAMVRSVYAATDGRAAERAATAIQEVLEDARPLRPRS